MERNCINCKWFRNTNCKCKDFINSINIVDNDYRYISYIEDGYFSENIKENIDIKKLAGNFVIALQEQGYTKKTKDPFKVNFEDEENSTFEYIENMLYQSIQNYFNGGIEPELRIKNPDEFSCCYWV